MKTKHRNRETQTRVGAWMICLGVFASLATPQDSWAQRLIEKQGEVEPHVKVRTYSDSQAPQAVVLANSSGATCTEPGKEPKKLKAGDMVTRGMVVRTDENGHVDLYFQRMGIMTRLAPNTECALDKTSDGNGGATTRVETIVDLRNGGMFCFVRSLVPDSRFEVKRNSAGEDPTALEIRSPDGAVSTKSSFVPPKVVSETATAVIVPGTKLDSKWTKPIKLAPGEEENTLIQLDELDAIAGKTTSSEKPGQK